MIEYVKTWLELKTDKRAVTALEYGLIAATMAAVLVGAMAVYGPAVTAVFTKLSSDLAP